MYVTTDGRGDKTSWILTKKEEQIVHEEINLILDHKYPEGALSSLGNYTFTIIGTMGSAALMAKVFTPSFTMGCNFKVEGRLPRRNCWNSQADLDWPREIARIL